MGADYRPELREEWWWLQEGHVNKRE